MVTNMLQRQLNCVATSSMGRCFDAAAGHAAEERARRKHPRVVAHEDVAGTQKGRQFGERTILELSAEAPADEQPRGVPPLDGMLGDKLRRQLVVEVGKGQRRGLRAGGAGSALRPAHPAFFRSRRAYQASHLLAAQPQ